MDNHPQIEMSEKKHISNKNTTLVINEKGVQALRGSSPVSLLSIKFSYALSANHKYHMFL